MASTVGATPHVEVGLKLHRPVEGWVRDDGTVVMEIDQSISWSCLTGNDTRNCVRERERERERVRREWGCEM